MSKRPLDVTSRLQALRARGVIGQLTGAELATLLVILSHTRPPEWACSEGITAIARAAGTSRRSCLRALKRLRELGLVHLDQPGPGHRGTWKLISAENATKTDHLNGERDEAAGTERCSRGRQVPGDLITGGPPQSLQQEHQAPLQLLLRELDQRGWIRALTYRQARVLLVLLARAEYGLVHATLGDLAKAARMDRKAAGQSLKSLEAIGIIQRYFRRGRGNVGAVRLLIPASTPSRGHDGNPTLVTPMPIRRLK